MHHNSTATAQRDVHHHQPRLAVLIDADNAPASVIVPLLEEVAKFGVATVKRIYGDWTAPPLKHWKDCLLAHAISPIQQFAYTKGKNASDCALIIDAMDLMYSRHFDGFCLVSSDSDFTRLAQRLREEGLTVYGFGEQKTPLAFVASCDRFVHLELLRATATAPTTAPVLSPAAEGSAPPVSSSAARSVVPVPPPISRRTSPTGMIDRPAWRSA